VIDDFGLMDLDLDKCQDLFEVLDTRDGRKSTVVISQFPASMTTTQKTYLHIIQELENKDVDLVRRSLSGLS